MLLMLFNTSSGSVTAGAEFGRSVNLQSFVSQIAHPGESIRFSDGSDIQGNLFDSLTGSNTYSTFDQAQRRKNWAILMEACLYACGGSGAASGAGWFSTGNNTPQEASPGSVFVPGPFWIEPYDTSALDATVNYAPHFGTRGTWTLPAFLTLWGNGRSGGGAGFNSAWNEVRSRFGPRILVVNAAFGWDTSGAPTNAYANAAINMWCVDGIAVTRRGSNVTNGRGSVFHVESWVNSSSTVQASDFWTVKSLEVEQDGNTYGGVIPVENGFVVRGGQGYRIEELMIFGGDSLGWSYIHTPSFNAARTTLQGSPCQAGSADKIVFDGGQRGVYFGFCEPVIRSLNVESPTPRAFQIVINNCTIGQIDQIHVEGVYSPVVTPLPTDPPELGGTVPSSGWAADDAVIVIGGLAPGAYESVDPATTGSQVAIASSNIAIGQVFMLCATPGSAAASNPNYGIVVNTGNVTLGGPLVQVSGARTAVLRAQPVGGSVYAVDIELNTKKLFRDGGTPYRVSCSTSGGTILANFSNRSSETITASMP